MRGDWIPSRAVEVSEVERKEGGSEVIEGSPNSKVVFLLLKPGRFLSFNAIADQKGSVIVTKL